ncbi:MAG TPA: hypothetical protein VGQ83_36045 [Polyangia bacterium]
MANRLLSVRIDAELVRSVRRSMRARSDSETLRRALELAREVEQTRRFLVRWGGKGGADAFAGREPSRP